MNVEFIDWYDENVDDLLNETFFDALDKTWMISSTVERDRIISIIKEVAGHRVIADELIKKINA